MDLQLVTRNKNIEKQNVDIYSSKHEFKVKNYKNIIQEGNKEKLIQTLMESME